MCSAARTGGTDASSALSRVFLRLLHRKWGDQDGGPGKQGTIIGDGDGWAKVKWDSGHENQYRAGAEGCFDLAYAEGEGAGAAKDPAKRVRGEPVTWVDIGARVQRGKDW